MSMQGSDKPDGSNSVSRRRMLQGISVASAAALAGCSGGGDNSGGGGGDDSGGGGDSGGGNDTETAAEGSAGERVPTLEIEYWSDMGSYTQVFEGSIPGIKKNLEDHLGLKVETIPVAFTTQISNAFSDKRTHHIGYWTHSLSPDRLDPFEFTWRFNATWAGANGSGNPANYANCTHTKAAWAQATATTESERAESVTKAFSTMSKDIGSIPIAQILRFGAYDSNTVEANSLGQAGLQHTGYRSIINSQTTNGEAINLNTNPVTAETRTHMSINSTGSLALWNHLFYSTLTEYNENFELENALAKDYSVSDGGTTFEVELRDATFHNGDPITAEDVKFTFEFIAENASEYPKASSPPYESIEVVDEKNVVFNTTEPYLPLISRIWPRWGILPKSVWEDANASENPRNVDLDPIVGSGPYKITNFAQGQIIQAEPHEGHPLFTPESDLNLQIFQDSQSAYRAFQNKEINMFYAAPAGIANQISESMDNAEVVPTEGFLPYVLYPQNQFGPAKHREFRMAISQAIDRNAANQTALYGQSKPMLHSSAVSPAHPSYAGEDNLTKIAKTAQSNPDVAKKALEDKGWSWDDNGRLRYPSDIDLEPRWPKGSSPNDMPDKFPCVDEVGN